MARLDRDGLLEAGKGIFGATADSTGVVDLEGEKGAVIVAAEATEFKAAFKRLKKLKDGRYKWILINREDVFAANSLSIGSRAGIMDAAGSVVKDAPPPKN